jgi:hypothetical protein
MDESYRLLDSFFEMVEWVSGRHYFFAAASVSFAFFAAASAAERALFA